MIMSWIKKAGMRPEGLPGRKNKDAYASCLHLHICERTTKAPLTEKQVQSVLKFGNKLNLRRRYLHATKGWKERAY